jgi:hypothetical protein
MADTEIESERFDKNTEGGSKQIIFSLYLTEPKGN